MDRRGTGARELALDSMAVTVIMPQKSRNLMICTEKARSLADQMCRIEGNCRSMCQTTLHPCTDSVLSIDHYCLSIPFLKEMYSFRCKNPVFFECKFWVLAIVSNTASFQGSFSDQLHVWFKFIRPLFKQHNKPMQ